MENLLYKVDPTTKRDLVLILCSLLERYEMDYSTLHKASKIFQTNLERKYGVTLGYKFNDISISKPWDDEFQNDLERWDAVAKLLIIYDSGSYIHLEIPQKTKLLLDALTLKNLDNRFDDFREFIGEVRKKVENLIKYS